MIDLCHRACPPEETYQRILPLLGACGITRLFDLTQLDSVGIPTYAATRPTGKVICVSNGKGATRAAAKVSALMEGIETFHAENPDPSLLIYSSEDHLAVQGQDFLSYHAYLNSAGCLSKPPEFVCSSSQLQRWVVSTELCGAKEYYLPAPSIYYIEPFAHSWCSNGLASGNSYDEAICHALYEVVERDAFSLFLNGILEAYSQRACFLELNSLPKELSALVSGFLSSDMKVYLMSLPCLADLHTFCFISVASADQNPLLRISLGIGTHSSAAIAASRAITECAQSRLALIHGAREDLYWSQHDAQNRSTEHSKFIGWLRVYGYFNQVSWPTFLQRQPDSPIHSSFSAQRHILCDKLASQGHERIFCADLKKPSIGIDVVKVFVPTLKLDGKIL
jgi:ribosomal protein S12 methylthiotransferase accessory factor